jgi:hypothetical protein
MRVGPQSVPSYKAKLFSAVNFPVKSGFQNCPGRLGGSEMFSDRNFPG